MLSCFLQDQLCPTVCFHATTSYSLHPSRCQCLLCLSNIFVPHQNLCERSHIHQIQAVFELLILVPIVDVCHNIEVTFFLVLASHHYSSNFHFLRCHYFNFLHMQSKLLMLIYLWYNIKHIELMIPWIHQWMMPKQNSWCCENLFTCLLKSNHFKSLPVYIEQILSFAPCVSTCILPIS